jgi:hypothetical protein
MGFIEVGFIALGLAFSLEGLVLFIAYLYSESDTEEEEDE